MPSFLTEDNAPVTSTPLSLPNLDPTSQSALSSQKHATNGDAIGPSHSVTTPDCFDGSSIISTYDSDLSATNPMPANEGGNGTRPTSMNSYTNGTSLNGGDDFHVSSVAANTQPNGKTTLPDRTAPARESSESQHAPSNGSPPEVYRKGLVSSAPRFPPPNAPTSNPTAARQSNESYTALQADSESNKSRTASITPTPQQGELLQPNSSPHRFSSPPAYQPGNSNLNSSPSGHLLPPGHPQSLKQRHTLEVPKPGRPSKDGMDTAQASGRFSPTAAVSGARRTSVNLARRNTKGAAPDAARDEVALDEDALRWAEAYRQKRASKRRKKEEEDDDRVLVGTKVDESHANWVTAYNMLTGIRVSVSRTNAKLDRDLTDADFEAKQKSTFDITGNELVPSAKYDFKFKDYAPWVFRRLRALFRLDPADYLMSLTGKYILSELGSPGKSGSFFYFSRDYKYIIKTIHHAEHKFLRKILKDYYNHVEQNPNTLLSQFYGLHRVKMPYGKKIHFVVMNNLFPPHRDIHATFDLKGSTVGRDYREDELEKNPRATLKDLNWLRRKRHLELGIQKKRLFLEQLRKDVVLLKRLQIMDYSLLVGIHDVSRGNEENLRDKTLQVFNPGGEKPSDDEPPPPLQRTPSKLETARKARELRQMIRQEKPIPMGQAVDRMPNELGEGHSRPGFVFNQDDGGFQATHEDNAPADEIYYLGVIDCLTRYGMIKKIEHFWKGLSSDRTQISALPPEQYGDRFYNFIQGVTMSHEEAVREQLRVEREAMEARQSSEKTPGRSGKQKLPHSIPPMPEHLPPPPPCAEPEARETIDMAAHELKKAEKHGSREWQVPDRTLKTVNSGEGLDSTRDGVLPVVEEAGEGSRDESSMQNRSDSPPAPTRAAPAPPIKEGRASTVSKGSVDKDLPPLPDGGTQDSGVRMTT